MSEVPELPGCISQGNTRDKAIDNVRDAVSGYVASLKKHNESVPFATDIGPVEIHVWASCYLCKRITKNAALIIRRSKAYPHRGITASNHKEIARGKLRSIIQGSQV